MKVLLLSFFFFLFVLVGRGAQVEWNCVQLTGSSNSHREINCQGLGFPLNVWVAFDGKSGSSWTLSPTGSNGLFIGCLFEACIGDIVDAAAVESVSEYFARAIDGVPSGTWMGIEGRGEQDIYLALALGSAWDESMQAYGWLQLHVANGTINLLASAIDLDGGPMIVGGGSATPEPSSSLLLLLGVGLLMLRRARISRTGYDDMAG